MTVDEVQDLRANQTTSNGEPAEDATGQTTGPGALCACGCGERLPRNHELGGRQVRRDARYLPGHKDVAHNRARRRRSPVARLVDPETGLHLDADPVATLVALAEATANAAPAVANLVESFDRSAVLALEAKLSAAQAEVAEQRARRSLVEDQLAQLTLELDDLRAAVDAGLIEQEKMADEGREATERASNLEHRVTELNERLEVAASATTAADDEREKALRAATELQEELNRLIADRAVLDSRINELHEQLRAAEAQRAAHEEETSRLALDVAEIRGELEQERRSRVEAEREREMAERAKLRAVASQRAARAEKRALQRQAEVAESRVAELTSQIRHLLRAALPVDIHPEAGEPLEPTAADEGGMCPTTGSVGRTQPLPLPVEGLTVTVPLPASGPGHASSPAGVDADDPSAPDWDDEVRLLTVDEANQLIGSTAITLVEIADVEPSRLRQLLLGEGSLEGLSPASIMAVQAHRVALHHLDRLGLGWLVDPTIQGALSYCAADIDGED